jgi:alkanesulfonate monooxygenase SsuD/methylene tetrahydromethanopterin reductase-like flavin-dependent oxidoreductase (luciferase family)
MTADRSRGVTPDLPTLGLNLPYVEGSMDGGTPRWADVRAMATTAEAMGFDAVWISDHAGFGVTEVLGRLLRPNSIDGLRAFAPVMEALRRPAD